MSYTSVSASREDRPHVASAAKLLLCISAFKLLVHLHAGRHYGYFVDELYYLACSRHLDWGYVDQPPLIALIAWMARSLLGDSLPAIRFFPAVAGAVKVALTAVLARELGGRLFAQGLAATAILVAPGFLALDNILSMNAFEGLFWLGCACLLVRIIKTANPRLWIWFGIVAGVGLENKHSMLIFGCGIFLGLVLTPQRRWLADRWFWIGGAIAFLIFVPNLAWNINHHFPFLELQSNIRRSGRNVPLGPIAFFGQQVLAMHPLALPIWLAGLWFYFFSKAGMPFRALGWAWVFTAAVIVGLSPRIYYLWPAFPALFAAGSVTLESLLARPRLHWIKLAYPTLLVVAGAVLSPQVIPVLPPQTYTEYAKALHFQPPAIETHKLGPLPQIYADQFGWEEMVATLAQVYHDLPSDIRVCSQYRVRDLAGAFRKRRGFV
jgi:4-amino-4-deoxy-L-arabinose transferase-like glycosyltransferase